MRPIKGSTIDGYQIGLVMMVRGIVAVQTLVAQKVAVISDDCAK